MNKIIIALSILLGLGLVSKAQAGRGGQGWNVTIVTGTAQTVFSGRGFFKKVTLSTGPSADYLVVMTTVPAGTVTGGSNLLIPSLATLSTTSIATVVYQSTASITNGGATVINNSFSLGDCDECYVEIPETGALHIRQTTQANGESNKAFVIWAK